MSLPRRLPPSEPDATLVALFTQPERIPKAVRRQADFFLFFALIEGAQEGLAFSAVLDYLVEQGWVPKRSRRP